MTDTNPKIPLPVIDDCLKIMMGLPLTSDIAPRSSDMRRTMQQAIEHALKSVGTPPPETQMRGDDWFSQVVAFFVKYGMLDERDEYDISDVMAAFADNYESRSVEDGDAIDAIQRLMETKKLSRKDVFPAKSRASEYLSRKRPLSIAAIRKLHFEHGIPAEILISPYRSTAGETP